MAKTLLSASDLVNILVPRSLIYIQCMIWIKLLSDSQYVIHCDISPYQKFLPLHMETLFCHR